MGSLGGMTTKIGYFQIFVLPLELACSLTSCRTGVWNTRPPAPPTMWGSSPSATPPLMEGRRIRHGCAVIGSVAVPRPGYGHGCAVFGSVAMPRPDFVLSRGGGFKGPPILNGANLRVNIKQNRTRDALPS